MTIPFVLKSSLPCGPRLSHMGRLRLLAGSKIGEYIVPKTVNPASAIVEDRGRVAAYPCASG